MSSLRAQLARLFLAPDVVELPAEPEVRWMPPAPGGTAAPVVGLPAEPDEPVEPVASHRYPRVAAVCGPREARLAGNALALGLLSGSRARTAVVLEWTGLEPAAADGGFGTPAARRAAALLRADGASARASGRVVRVGLPAVESAGAAAARAIAGGLSSPAVLVIAGPRGTAMADLLAEQDRIVLVQGPSLDADLARLAGRELASLGPPSAVLEPPAALVAAALARIGTAVVAALREAVSGALATRS